MNIIKADENRLIKLENISTQAMRGYEDKQEIKRDLKSNIKRMAQLQNMLYAQDKYALLIIFQAMDAAGKDSMIRRVMTGLNPQGTQVFSFKKPADEDLDHDYLWRAHMRMPERGRIGIFNRSYYEEVLVVRVHDLIRQRKIPQELLTDDIWKQRFNEIKTFEEYLNSNGTVILKFFLHISKEEQKRRFLGRIDNPAKNWKFSSADLEERQHWDKYQQCYEDAINNTATSLSPWYVIPSDNKWYARRMVSQIIAERMDKMNLHYPTLDRQHLEKLDEYKKQLEES